jgi:hypothetical protein
MWVRNPDKVDARLVRGHVTEELAVAAMVVPQAYAVAKKGLIALHEPPAPADHDPPDTAIYSIWDGVSVTVAGHVEGPSKPPFARLVTLRIGDIERSIAVFGDRVWEKSVFGGGLAPSNPKPFDRLELSVERAYGGGYDVPPGLIPGDDLPHPGFRCAHQLNPKGVGLYADEASALGSPLPNFERRGALLERWNDAPEPVAFSPCSELVGWRSWADAERFMAEHIASGGTPDDLPPPPPSFRVLHHAPPELIFDDIAAGTHVELDGFSGGPVRLDVPACPVRFAIEPWRKGTASVEVPPRLRSIHIDADRQLLLTTYALSFRYNRQRAPRLARLTREIGAFV